MQKIITKSILAGLLISVAGWAYLECLKLNLDSWSKVIGAVLFSLGLVGVIILDASLFTGKVGYIDSSQKFKDSLIILGFNLVTAFIVGLVYQKAVGCSTIMEGVLSKSWYRVLLDGVGTGICIYLAVEGYTLTKSFIPVILGVCTFILSGFIHCIAVTFYFGACQLSFKGLVYILISVIGNSIGSFAIRALQTHFWLKK